MRESTGLSCRKSFATAAPAGLNGRHSFFIPRWEIMKQDWLTITKTLVKSSLDNYILPGTLTSTEILLVYLSEWKRSVLIITSVLILFAKLGTGPPSLRKNFRQQSGEAPAAE